MADGHGGYREPANPAPVSGPGKYAKRTDGGPAQAMSAAPDQPYGQITADMNAQRIAPMGAAAPAPPAAQPSAGPPTGAGGAPPTLQQYQGGPLDAPSQRPGEPVTAGMPFGPGAGPEALSAPTPAPQQGPVGSMTATIQKYAPADATGAIAQLLQAAASHGV